MSPGKDTIMLLYANYFLTLFMQLFSNLVIIVKISWYISVHFQILKMLKYNISIINEKLVRADNFSLTKNLLFFFFSQNDIH